MLKHELRKRYIEKRRTLDFSSTETYSHSIANRLLQIPIWDFFYFHLFLSIMEKKEVDTSPIITILHAKDKNIVIPKMGNENQLKNYLLTDSTLIKKNKWLVPEPQDGIEVPEHKIDVVFVPLLSFDVTGHRVGYGKGYYDIFLQKCRPKTIKIGLSFFGPEKKIVDINAGDVKLDYCITPNKTYSF
ncbi:MAG: 5-formyltetrahydrofolate cyclo-ligase [Bacteroidota bacterium]